MEARSSATLPNMSNMTLSLTPHRQPVAGEDCEDGEVNEHVLTLKLSDRANMSIYDILATRLPLEIVDIIMIPIVTIIQKWLRGTIDRNNYPIRLIQTKKARWRRTWGWWVEGHPILGKYAPGY